jgi:hypothetical protein
MLIGVGLTSFAPQVSADSQCPTTPAAAFTKYGGNPNGWTQFGENAVHYQATPGVTIQVPQGGEIWPVGDYIIYTFGDTTPSLSYFVLSCSQPGTPFTPHPPLYCPTTIPNATRELGGDGWHYPNESVQTNSRYLELDYDGSDATFFVPFGTGVHTPDGKEYPTGFQVVGQSHFTLTCLNSSHDTPSQHPQVEYKGLPDPTVYQTCGLSDALRVGGDPEDWGIWWDYDGVGKPIDPHWLFYRKYPGSTKPAITLKAPVDADLQTEIDPTGQPYFYIITRAGQNTSKPVQTAFFYCKAYSTPPAGTATPTPPVTPTTTPTNTECQPRPQVDVVVTRIDANRKQVKLQTHDFGSTFAQPNLLSNLHFTATTNAVVEINGQSRSGDFSVVPGQPSVTFIVRRLNPAQAATVAFIAQDACGDWSSFVGGGINGW